MTVENVMLKALSAFEFSGDSEFAPFAAAVRKYAHFEREHARLEEREILPLARESLRAEDWSEIDAAFGENADPLFGQRWNDEFSRLFEQLVNRLPAPLGFGDTWQA